MKTNLIKEENISSLLDKINYSIKSNLDSNRIFKDINSSGEIERYNTSIRIIFNKGTYSSKTHIYDISVKKFVSKKFFGLIDNSSYYIKIDIDTKDYSDKIEIEERFNTKLGSKILDIWNTLATADDQKEMDLSNKRAVQAIEDISTTIDKSFNRDETLDKILN